MQFDPDEQVFFHGHPSWRSILDYYAKGLFLAIAAGAVAGVATAIADGHVKVGWVVAAVLPVFAAMVLYGLVKLLSTTYAITSRRLTINTGLLRRDMHETRIERVQNVNCSQSMLERTLGIGTVDFDTAAGAEYDFKFTGVGNPREIVRTVDRAIHQLQQTTPGV
ncbi:MAG TPA: PH domain-containing protein [Solirubrobacteraceae bacterium]|nr:PH domain-containing protein [Solirubrobacteraceae bacterium]